MEINFDIKNKVKQGELSEASDGKQPNRESVNIDFKEHAPGKYEADVVLKKIDYPTKSGSEHIQQSLFSMADEKDY
jgi:hypothetical protein